MEETQRSGGEGTAGEGDLLRQDSQGSTIREKVRKWLGTQYLCAVSRVYTKNPFYG